MSCSGPPPDAFGYGNTLLAKLAPCIDKIRGYNATVGLRPYHVYMVHTRWSGTTAGDGIESVLEQEELLPVPKIESMASIRFQLQSVGITEVGDLTVSEISTKYNEFQLRGLKPDGSNYPRNESTYWEVHFLRADNSGAIRRRFVVTGIPSMNPGRVEWVVSLTRAHNDRDQAGVP